MERTQSSGPFFLGIDLGGTNVKVGVVADAGLSLSKVKVKTEAAKGPEVGVANIERASRDAISKAGLKPDDLAGIGLATPGTMDIPAGMLLHPHNLPGWNDFPIRQSVQDRLQKPTVLQNDANAAAYGEFWVGAGRDAHSLVFWTLGTGIGCGIIVNDMIIQGEHSHGSECGHIIIAMDKGRYCLSGQFGTLEAYASATALIARCHEALDAGEQTVIKQWLNEGQKLTPVLIADAANQGDKLADQLIMDTAKYMGVGTTTLMHTIDPDMVLYGGAMTFGRHDTELGRRFLQRIKDEVKLRAFPIPYARTILDYATLGGDAGYIGAAGCARMAFNKSK